MLVGAEAVVENGGAINKLGTYQVGRCQRACRAVPAARRRAALARPLCAAQQGCSSRFAGSVQPSMPGMLQLLSRCLAAPPAPPAALQVAIAAKEHNVPVYVAAESYKFARCVRGGALGALPPRGSFAAAPLI